MTAKYRVTPTAPVPGGTPGVEGVPEIHEGDFAAIGQNGINDNSAIVDDHIVKPGAEDCVRGGDWQLAGGMSIFIFKPLRVYRGSDGKMFADQDPAVKTLTLAPADPDLPRIDLIYAKLEEDKDSGAQTRHFIEDPTSEGSPDGDVEAFFDKVNRVTVFAVTGEPNANPARPVLPADGVLLYEVLVEAGITKLAGTITDLRHTFKTLEEVSEILGRHDDDIDKLKKTDHRHPAVQIDVAAPGNRLGDTVQDVINNLAGKSDEDILDRIWRPEILTPEIAPSNGAAGKLGTVGAVDGATPCIDIPIGREVDFFGGPRRKIEVGSFPATVEGVALNARIVNKHVNQATQSRQNSVPLTLAAIDSVQSGSGGEFTNLNAPPPTDVSAYAAGRRTVARDGRYLEHFGGAGVGNSSWLTFDSSDKSFTARNFLGDIPVTPIVAAYTLGNGKALVCALDGADHTAQKRKWYVVDLATGQATLNTGGPGGAADPLALSYVVTIGELVEAGVVLLMIGHTNPGNNQYGQKWAIYHIASNTFEYFTPTGPGPQSGAAAGLNAHWCALYKPGQAIFFSDGRAPGGMKTHTFSYSTRSFTAHNIAQPALALSLSLIGAAMINIGGRVYFYYQSFEADPTGATNPTAFLWELQPADAPEWKRLVTGLPLRYYPALGSLLRGGLASGAGYFMSGTTPQLGASPASDTWGFASGGIVEVVCGGVTGLSLGEGVSEATFRLKDDYALPWQVAKVLANPIGNLPPGSIEISYSFDNDTTRQTIPRDTITTVQNSSVNPSRKVWITLRGTQNDRPCINRLNEIFEQVGGPGLVQTVIRINIITTGVRWVYIHRDGRVTIEQTAQETTADKAILVQITPNGVAPATGQPTPHDYINQRIIQRYYINQRNGGQTPATINELPCRPRKVTAMLRLGADDTLKFLATPVVDFNVPITVNGVPNNGDYYILEIDA